MSNPDEAAYSLDCLVENHGFLGTVMFCDIGNALMSHFTMEHPGVSVIRSGSEYRFYPAPPRCDSCGIIAERPWWTHTATPPIQELEDLDGQWLLCVPCHDLYAAGDREGVLDRVVEVAQLNSPGLMTAEKIPRLRSTMVEKVEIALARFDEGTLEGVG